MFGCCCCCCCESTHAKDHRTTPVIRGNFTERLFSEAGNVAPRVYRSWCCAKNRGSRRKGNFYANDSQHEIVRYNYLLILGIA